MAKSLNNEMKNIRHKRFIFERLISLNGEEVENIATREGKERKTLNLYFKMNHTLATIYARCALICINLIQKPLKQKVKLLRKMIFERIFQLAYRSWK